MGRDAYFYAVNRPIVLRTLEILDLDSLLPGMAGGGRGIRTPVPVARKAIFKTAALNHSAIPPQNILPVTPSARKSMVLPSFAVGGNCSDT